MIHPLPSPTPSAPPAAPPSWRQRWQERRRQGWGPLAYRVLRRALDVSRAGRHLEFHWRQVIAVVPARMRLPPRLARELVVRELVGPAAAPAAHDLASLTALRPAQGLAYAQRFAAGHRAWGAFFGRRLVAFVWLRLGPAEIPSTFGAVWQVSAPLAWIYDLYSDPQVLGAIPHLYAYLRLHPPGESCRWLVGQTEGDNLRSRKAHDRLGYEPVATLWSWRCGRRWWHLSRAHGDHRWRWHSGRGRIPLPLFTAAASRLPGPQLVNPPESCAAPAREPRFWLQCECGRRVELAGDRYRCSCGHELGRRSEGMATVGDPIPYWGEIPQPEMAAVLDRAARAGWREALASLTPELRNYIAGPGRADFQDLVPLPPAARVLDVGAGWGGIAAVLARQYPVVALEGVRERARFIALRGQQEGLSRLTVINGDVHRTPLACGQFDAIVANGILEWAALLDLDSPPQAVQLAFLDRLASLLAPGGVIYVGIENRVGWAELRGALDHSGLPYTSLLPRPLARSVCAHSRRYRAHFNVGYRTYTYTYRGYRDLFAQVGLRIRSTWISPMGYNAPAKLVPLTGSAIRFCQTPRIASPAGAIRWKQSLRRLAAAPALWRWFGSDFAFLLEPAATVASVRLLRDAAPAQRAEAPQPLSESHIA